MLEQIVNSVKSKIINHLKLIDSLEKLNKQRLSDLKKLFALSHIKIAEIPTITTKSRRASLVGLPSGISFDPNKPINYYEIVIPIISGLEIAGKIYFPQNPFTYKNGDFYKEDYPSPQPANLLDDEIVADFRSRIKREVNSLNEIINTVNSNIDEENGILAEFITEQIELRRKEFIQAEENLKKINPFL